LEDTEGTDSDSVSSETLCLKKRSYRRWKARLGNKKAVTAMAHKLARVLWHLLKYKQAFDWKVFEKEEAKMKRKKLARLQNMAASLNLQLGSTT